MKFVVLLCLYFVSFHQPGHAENETTTALPTDKSSSIESVSTTETTTKLSSTDANFAVSASTVATESLNNVTSTLTGETTDTTTTSVTDESSTASAVVGTDSTFSVTETSSATPTTATIDTSSAIPTVAATETSSAIPASAESILTITETTTTALPEMKSVISFLDKLSDQIRNIIRHYQTPEAVGFPGQKVLPDPLPAPNATEDLGIFTGHFYDMSVHGLSNFTIESINTLLDQLVVYVQIEIKKVFIIGNCTFENMFFSTRGPFNITLDNVTAEGTVYLVVDPDGTVRANRSVTTMSYQQLNFQLGTNGSSSLVQSAVNAAGIAVITALRPYILRRIDERLTDEVNKELKITPKFPKVSSQSPVDLAIFEAQQYIRQKYEPYTIENIVNHDSEYLNVNIGPAKVYGLSKFARVGDITLGMANGTVITKLRILTGRLRGECKFNFNFGKVGPSRYGDSKFSVQHLQFEALLKQPINLKKKPILEDLQLEVGAISVHLDGAGKFDYLLELLVQLLPKMLRHFIIDALEEPIKQKIQTDILDLVNVEQLVEDNLSLIEKLVLNTS